MSQQQFEQLRDEAQDAFAQGLCQSMDESARGTTEGGEREPAKDPAQAPAGSSGTPTGDPENDLQQEPPVFQPVCPGPLTAVQEQPEPPLEPQPEPRAESRPQAEQGTVAIPDEIRSEWESLKELSPESAELAREDSPDGRAVRARLEQFGAEIAMDRAEMTLYRRNQARAGEQAEQERSRREIEAHNASFAATLHRECPGYAALLFDQSRRAEAEKYQQDVYGWIASKPYAQAVPLMEVAQRGRDPRQVAALINQFESERKAALPDPTPALAVHGRGASVAPVGIGDKDDFTAGFDLSLSSK